MIGEGAWSRRVIYLDRETKSRKRRVGDGDILRNSEKRRKARREILILFALLPPLPPLPPSQPFFIVSTRLRTNVRNNRIYTPTPTACSVQPSLSTFLGYNDISFATWRLCILRTRILTRRNRRSVRSSGKSDVILSLFQPISSLL